MRPKYMGRNVGDKYMWLIGEVWDMERSHDVWRISFIFNEWLSYDMIWYDIHFGYDTDSVIVYLTTVPLLCTALILCNSAVLTWYSLYTISDIWNGCTIVVCCALCVDSLCVCVWLPLYSIRYPWVPINTPPDWIHCLWQWLTL